MLEASRATAPATTGEAAEVPVCALQPDGTLLPMTLVAKATTSGFTRPYPAGSSQVVIPRLLKGAMLSSRSTRPPQ